MVFVVTTQVLLQIFGILFCRQTMFLRYIRGISITGSESVCLCKQHVHWLTYAVVNACLLTHMSASGGVLLVLCICVPGGYVQVTLS